MTTRLVPIAVCLAIAILPSEHAGVSPRDLPGADAPGRQSTVTGAMRLTFTQHGSTDVTAVSGTVYLELPGGGSRQRRVDSFRRPLDIEAMPPGAHRITVVAQSMTSVLVAARVQEVAVASGTTATLVVDLIERDGAIRVIDAAGAPVAGAHYYTSPSAVNSTADDAAEIRLAMLASGTALTVRTIQWGMTCHLVTDADQQTVVVPDAVEELVLVAPTTPTSGLPQRRVIVPSAVLTGAMVSGVPGADCAIPWEHFPVTLARAGGMTEHTMLLPFGDYVVRLRDGRTLQARAPGRLELR